MDNLEWVTHKENTKHAAKMGLLKYLKLNARSGEECNFSKLTREDVSFIRHDAIHTNVELAKMIGCSTCTVSLIRNGKTWKHTVDAKINNKRRDKLFSDERVYCAVDKSGHIVTPKGSSSKTRYFKTTKYLTDIVESHNIYHEDNQWKIMCFKLTLDEKTTSELQSTGAARD